MKKLFQTPAITITDVLQKRNLCQSILPYIKEILKRLGNPDPCKIISVLNPEENETSNTPDLGDIRWYRQVSIKNGNTWNTNNKISKKRKNVKERGKKKVSRGLLRFDFVKKWWVKLYVVRWWSWLYFRIKYWSSNIIKTVKNSFL